MKRNALTSLLLSVLLASSAAGQSRQTSRSRPVVFTHVTVIDATGAAAKPDMTVVIAADRISRIGESKQVRIPGNAEVIDARGKYLVPGLWDMHVHLAKAGENSLALFLANGVTSVRDMGGDPALT